MNDVEPLTGEEILFVRRMLNRRTLIAKGLWTALGAAIMGAIWAVVKEW